MGKLSKGLRRSVATALLLIGIFASAALAAIPAGYPRSYSRIIELAMRERALIIYSTTDRHEVEPLLQAFRQRYPFLRVSYIELGAAELHKRALREMAANRGSADVIWSGAMDLQIKLVNDGYAQPYASPEKPALPPWAIWKNEAYGVTAEPVVFAYHKKLVPAADLPRTHAEFLRLLRAKSAFYRGKVATYDPSGSASGFLFLNQDLQINRDTWKIVQAFGATGATFHGTSREMLDRLSAGKALLLYNIIGSYALEQRARDPSIGVIMPADYTLVMSRIALIPTEAIHPNAAKLFLDFLLSRSGQKLLTLRYMTSVRRDVSPPAGARPHPEVARAIQVGPALLASQDQVKRRRFFMEWRRTLAAGQSPSAFGP